MRKFFRLATFFLIAALSIQILNMKLYAADSTVVRVGLLYKYQNVSYVPVTSYRVEIGFEYGGVFVPSGTVAADSYFTVTYDAAYYIRMDTNYMEFAAAEAAAAAGSAAWGVSAVPCLINLNAWRVYVGAFASQAEAQSKAEQIGEGSVVQSGRRTLLFKAGDRTAAMTDSPDYFPQIRVPDSETVPLNDRKYRGRIEFERLENGKITAVNVVLMDEYLYSVVPSEMPSGWQFEALKAQACAARTYVREKMGKSPELGYDVCDGTHCQVYNGFAHEKETTTRAVNETSGMYIYYQGKLIQAMFSASSGGYTASSEDVWSETLPYLRAVKEINETAEEWTRTFTMTELSAVLAANSVNIGTPTGMTIKSTGEGGRVTELVINGTSGSKSLTKEAIRTFFSSSADGSLKSRIFTITNGVVVKSDTKAGVLGIGDAPLRSLSILAGGGKTDRIADGYANITVLGAGGQTKRMSVETATVEQNGSKNIVLVGKGNGHGAGMSQNGANGMAEMGYTYDQILKYYYTGVEVRLSDGQ